MKPRKNKTHNPAHTRDLRKSLRTNLTPAEAFLWTHLQKQQLAGRKFRRQHGVGSYVVDFYCAAEQLVIELDGAVHQNATAVEKDAKRTAFLESKGLKVLRFENKMVFDFLPSVLKEIEDNFKLMKDRTRSVHAKA